MTTQNILPGVILAAALSAVGSAQQSLSTTTVTVRGCLQSDPNSTGVVSDRFVLRYATMGIGSTTEEAAEGAGAQAGATKTSYILSGSTTELRKYTDQQVEITGRFEARAETLPGRSDPLDRPGESSTASSRLGPRLRVDSLRSVAPMCSR
jgi:hypothetical protein